MLNLALFCNDLLCAGRVASTPKTRQMSVTLDRVGEVENPFLQLAAERACSPLGDGDASSSDVVIKHISVPDFKPQLQTHLHRPQVVGDVPRWVVVVHHRLCFLVHAVVEDLNEGVRLREGVGRQACSSVDRQSESSSARP